MNSSIRGLNLPFSPIRSLMPFAREAKEKGIEILHLNIGQPDIPAPKEALFGLQNFSLDNIPYGDSEGLDSLRSKVAHYYQKFDTKIDKSNVLVTTGASEAIQFSLFSCLNPGDEVIIPEPFYANYLGYAQIANVIIVPIACDFSSGFDLPNIEQFDRLVTKRTKAILICNPNNPTGSCYSKEALESLSKLILDKELFLIVDEVYKEFCYEQDFFSILNICLLYTSPSPRD